MIRPDGEPWTLAAFTEGALTTAAWSIAVRSELWGGWDFAAEHYHPRKLLFLRRLNEQAKDTVQHHYRPVRNLFDSSRTPPPANARVYDLTDALGNLLTDGQPAESAEDIGSTKKIARPGDVVISRLRSYLREAAVVPMAEHTFLLSTEFIVLRRHATGQPHFLLPYLLSEPVQTILQWSQDGSNHPRFAEGVLADLPLPDVVLDNQEQLSNAVVQAMELFARSKALYCEAETLLLSELGLEDLDLSHEPTYTQNCSQARAAGRLDAEYFQPKYERVMGALKSIGAHGIVPLNDLLTTITNGHTPLRHDLSVGEVLFITAEFLADFRVGFDTDKRILREHHDTELRRTALREGDLLVTIKGRIGNAAVVTHLPSDTNINQDVALLRVRPGIHPYYVAAFLNSDAGKALTDQACTGQINPFLGLGNLRTVPIPVFSPERMNELGDRVQSVVDHAYQAGQESKRLLEEAKRRVEEMVLGGVWITKDTKDRERHERASG